MAHSTAFPKIAENTAHLHSTMAATQVLAIGPWQQAEFAAATAQIPLAEPWQTASDIDLACHILANCDLSPELILLAQPLPNTYLQAKIDHLQRLAPLARLVIVAGTWCEGEVRTGSPPAGVLRLYWYDLAGWWQAALRRLDTGLCPLWSLPFDHPFAGRYSTENPLLTPTVTEPTGTETTATETTVLVAATDYAVYETLAAALQPRAVVFRWQAAETPEKAAAGIWDGGQLSNRELASLTHFCRQVTGPVIALLDFPRVEHLQQTRAAGATAVFAKPYIVEELIAAVLPL